MRVTKLSGILITNRYYIRSFLQEK